MFKARTSSLRKNMAILVCAAFILLVFPEVTQAATKPSSRTSHFLKESSPLISAVFSFVSLNSSPLGYDLAFLLGVTNNWLILPDESKQDKWDMAAKKKKSYTKSNANSTSQKTPQDKDK